MALSGYYEDISYRFSWLRATLQRLSQKILISKHSAQRDSVESALVACSYIKSKNVYTFLNSSPY